MSTLKVDTYLTRGGASEIAIDKLKGVTAAGSMLVVGEGGTNTTNLQQGLGKAWVNLNGTGTAALRDSYNVSGITDNGTGDYTTTWATAMSSGNYLPNVIGYKSAEMFLVSGNNTSISASSFRAGEMYAWNGVSSANAANSDFSIFGALIHGDLA